MYQKPANMDAVNTLKQELIIALKKNDYDLLSDEVLTLSTKLDVILLPIFQEQINKYYPFSLI